MVGQSAGLPAGQINDELLAAKLVELERLNRWQAGQLRAGRTSFNLGPYQIIDFIGKGGMGQVYKAEHSIMGRVVAVKVLPLNKSTPKSVANFTREIRTQAQLDHENLVRAYDAGHDRNVHFLVTEYVAGTDLRRLIRRQGKLSMQAAASVIVQAAKGLGYAHGRGLIHRDVKPGNLLVTPEWRTKVSDLGLAGFLIDSDEADVYGGKTVGTADYLAPERITAPDRLTPASDLYALGCTLYYAVTGKVPFPGGTARDKALAHCQMPPLDPRRLNPDLSDEFVEVLGDLMAKNPLERVQTAAEVQARLAPWSQGAEMPASQGGSSSPFWLPARVAESTSPAFPSIPTALSDTEPNFLLELAEEHGYSESPSQVTLGTQPFAAGSQETLPVSFPDWERRRSRYLVGDLPLLVKGLILVGIVSAVGALLAVLFGLAYATWGS